MRIRWWRAVRVVVSQRVSSGWLSPCLGFVFQSTLLSCSRVTSRPVLELQPADGRLFSTAGRPPHATPRENRLCSAKTAIECPRGASASILPSPVFFPSSHCLSSLSRLVTGSSRLESNRSILPPFPASLLENGHTNRNQIACARVCGLTRVKATGGPEGRLRGGDGRGGSGGWRQAVEGRQQTHTAGGRW